MGVWTLISLAALLPRCFLDINNSDSRRMLAGSCANCMEGTCISTCPDECTSTCDVNRCFPYCRFSCGHITCGACKSDFFYLAYGQCHRCVHPCGECEGNGICKSCGSGYFLVVGGQFNKRCKTECPNDSYYKVESSKTCELCKNNCKTCNGESICLSCKPVFNFLTGEDINGQCIEGCPPSKEYFDDGVGHCLPCINGCKTCNSITDCLSCNPTHNLCIGGPNNGKCTIVCPSSGLYYNDGNGHCQLCKNHCLTCTTITNCISCQPDYSLCIAGPLEGECHLLCPDLYQNNNAFSCLLCISNCPTCLNSTYCYSCQPEFNLCRSGWNDGACLSVCPLSGYFLNSPFCDVCYSTCSECSGHTSTNCTKCIPKYLYLKTHECIEFCPPGTFYNELELICEKCDSRCMACEEPSNLHCSFCSKDEGVARYGDGSCDCLINYYYVYSSQLIRYLCQKCHNNCYSCKGGTEYDCLSCQSQMIYNSEHFSCTCPLTHFNSNGICILCDEACNQCNGTSNEECIYCNTHDGFYALESQPSVCLFLCRTANITTPLFLDASTNTCKPCHKNCFSCYDDLNTTCIKCNPEYYLGKGTECLFHDCSNYENTFPTNNNICERCNPICKGCINTPNSCLSCIEPYLFLGATNSCLIDCPMSYYSYIQIQMCQKCPDNCLTCERINFINPKESSPKNFHCLSCSTPNYFLSSTNLCVKDIDCGINYYPETATMTCNLCHKTCLGCFGPDIFECKDCAQGFIMNSQRICVKAMCLNGEYFDLNTYNCGKCPKVCKRCIGPTTNDCTSCPRDLYPKSIPNLKISHSCVPCEEISGYYTHKSPLSSTNVCREICGDGLNMGEVGCDDGNKENKDGCSRQCQVEEGFACQGGSLNNRDICSDIQSPTIAISLTPTDAYNYIYDFHFSETVIAISDNAHKSFINLSISGKFEEYLYDYEVELLKNSNNIEARILDDIPKSKGLVEFYMGMQVNLIPMSSLMDDDPNVISDISGNILHGVTMNIKLVRFNYLDPADKAMIDKSGNSVFYSMLGLLSLNIIIAIICAGSMSFLFPLFNMIQLISILPLLQIDLPENLRAFIKEYLQFANFNFGFLYNPFHMWNIINLAEMNNNPLNENFELNEVNSRVLIVNYGGQLVIWTIVAFLYLPICIIAKCCGFKKFKELKETYEYGVLITSFSEAFVEFTLYSFLNIYQLEFSSKATCIASIIGLSGMLLSCTYIVFILNLISHLGRDLKEESNIQMFGVLYSDTNYHSHENRKKLSQYYNIIFLLRRLLYILIILFLYKTPIPQQAFNISIHLLIFIYDITLLPYSTGLLGILTYFFDFILVLIFGSLPLYLVYINHAEEIGRIHIYLLVATIAFSWIIIIGVNILTLWKYMQTIRQARKLREQISFIDKYLEGRVSVVMLAKHTGRRTDFRKKT